MFARTLVVLAVALSAAASPTKRDTCTSGTVSCCNQLAPASQAPLASLLPLLLAANIQDANVPVGLECTPLSVLGGATAGNCDAQTVCCDHTTEDGSVAVGCSPFNAAF